MESDSRGVVADLLLAAIRTHVAEGKFGILVQNSPAFDVCRFLDGLASLRVEGIRARVAYPVAMDQRVGKIEREAVESAGEHVSTFVEDAVRWRDEPDVEDLIVVIAPRELPKQRSLADLSLLSANELYDQLLTVGRSTLGKLNLRQDLLWQALGDARVREETPLDGLTRLYGAVSGHEAAVGVQMLPSALHLLGLLPDPQLFEGRTTKGEIAKRLLANRRLVRQISTLTKGVRARLRANASSSSDPALKAVLAKVFQYARDRNPGHLHELRFEQVDALFGAKSAPSPSRKPKREERTAVEATVDAILDGRPDLLADLDEQIRGEHGDLSPDRARDPGADADAADDDGDDEGASGRRRDVAGADGVTTSFEAPRHLVDLCRRAVTETTWGGVFDAPGYAFREALNSLSTLPLDPFDPVREDWPGVRLPMAVSRIPALPRDLADKFEEVRNTRAKLVPHAFRLVAIPDIAIGRSDGLLDAARAYLRAWEEFLSLFKVGYSAYQAASADGARKAGAQLLALDTILFRDHLRWQGLLSPLHPLHLWKWVALVEKMQSTTGLSERERELLKERAQALPCFVPMMYLNEYITGERARFLVETGSEGTLPVFEEVDRPYHGSEGIDQLPRLFERFASLYPHARNGLRITVVDPPQLASLLLMVAKLIEAEEAQIRSLHVRVLRTRRALESLRVSGDPQEEEELAEAFNQPGRRRLELEIDNEVRSYDELGEALAKKPAHITVLFDSSSLKVKKFSRHESPPLHPLSVPREFRYDVMEDKVDIVPAADHGLFALYKEIVNKLNDNLAGTHLALSRDLALKREELNGFLDASTWVVVADRAIDEEVAADVHRIYFRAGIRRDIALYTRSVAKFENEFDRTLRTANAVPTPEQLRSLVDDLGRLVGDGLLGLVLRRDEASAFDSKKTRGTLGTLFWARWWRQLYGEALLVSLDTFEARRWLMLDEVEDDHHRADILAVRLEDEGARIVVSVVEVKTTEDRPYALDRDDPRIVTGSAVEQLALTSRLMFDVFTMNDEHILTPARRELVRVQLAAACFDSRQTAEQKQLWANALNEAFRGELPVEVERHLVWVHLGSGPIELPRFHHIREPGGPTVCVTRLSENLLTDAGKVEEARLSLSGIHRDDPSPSAPESDPDEGGTPPPGGPAGGGSGAAPLASSPVAASAPAVAAAPSDDSLKVLDRTAKLLNRALADYGVEAAAIDTARAQVGPSIIRYLVQLKPGERLSKLQSVAEDLARSVESSRVPIIDNMLGTPFVYIDLPNPSQRAVPIGPALRALAERRPGELRFLVGVTPAGDRLELDLARLPHLLVAGTSGSGKTVFLYGMLLSLLAGRGPSELRLLLVDPKQTDFAFFDGLPHLETGRVVIDPAEAVEHLRALLNEELPRRTEQLREARVRDIVEFNRTARIAMPPMVVVIDEFADLMDVLPKKERDEFEQQVNRMAQRTRSVGIHLVIATQRPDVKVVTGRLKSNLNCRVSFALPSAVDSKTILDFGGAERLLGKGDMLLKHEDKLTRLQGYYVSSAELDELLGRATS